MKEDWDFVTFDNYSKDMDGLAETARAVINKLMEEKKEILRMLHAVVAEVGTVIVPQDIFIGDPVPFTVERDDCNLAYIIKRNP